MSSEGYYQMICKNGHQYYAGFYTEEEKTKCPDCGEDNVWWHIVDQTNDEGYEIPLRVKDKGKTCTCSECGHTHLLEEGTYNIPTKEEEKEAYRVYMLSHGWSEEELEEIEKE